MDFAAYVQAHLQRRITVGQSGAGVYELDGSQIAKHVERRALESDTLWEAYRREYLFYTRFSAVEVPFLPVLYHCFGSDEEIQFLMKQYRPLERAALEPAMLEKILAVLVRIHALPVPDFLPQPDPEPFRLDPRQILRCQRGWQEVLDEHGQEFAAYDLSRVAECINPVNEKARCRNHVLCHGDFHIENLLVDEGGDIIVCDWQNVSVGHAAGDLSFLLSRLSADGYPVDKEQVISTYCRYSSPGISSEEIGVQMSLSNLNTAFVFWHEYLHGCPAGRVQDVLQGMFEALDVLRRESD